MLGMAVQLSGWATPRSTEAGHSTGNPERAIDNKSRLEDQVFLSGWATPTSRDYKDGAANLGNVPVNKLLGREVLLTGWPTPDARGFTTSNPETALNERARKRRLTDSFTLGEAAHLPGDSVEWLPCADGKARPTQPGTSPAG